MAKRYIQKFIIYILSIPFRIASQLYVARNVCNIKTDIKLALQTVDQHKNVELDDFFITTLIIAEDKRNHYHHGVDPIGMLRAVKVRLLYCKRQGASTIEQQFVRVVSNRYERSFKRKFHEQMLAIAVSKQRGKKNIAKAYLAIAYYGTGLLGIQGIIKKCPSGIKQADKQEVIGIVSRLKYPEPKKMSCLWNQKHEKRNKYISNHCAIGL